MTHVILALVLNLYSSAWVDPAGVLAEPRTKLVTGLNILIDSLVRLQAWAAKNLVPLLRSVRRQVGAQLEANQTQAVDGLEWGTNPLPSTNGC